MRECSAVVCGRLPDGIVQVSRAFADRTVKLGRNEARLPLHKQRVVPPDLEEGLFVRVVEREHVHQHDWGGFDRELTFDREGRVQGAQ
jgi:hypothetical protein